MKALNHGLAFSATLCSACAGPRMGPPPDVAANARVLEVTDRSRATGMLADESFMLGKLKITAVDRDATSKSGFSVGGYGKSSTTTGYTFELSGKSGTFKGGCGSESKQQGFSLGGGSSVDWGKTRITCECKKGEATGSIVLEGKSDGAAGMLTLEGTTYNVTPVEETDSSSFGSGPAGFRADTGGKPLGAVETLYPGRVWLAKELEGDRAEQLACLFAGLMLYVPPRED
jgi:hypothetical protein